MIWILSQKGYLCNLRNSLKYIGLYCILIVFGFLLSQANTLHAKNVATDFSFQPESKSESKISHQNTDLYSAARQTENLVNLFRTLTIKSFTKQFWDANNASQVFYNQVFLQYHFFSHYLISRITSSDIIFPFHYFW